jgi:hypothetical protein
MTRPSNTERSRYLMQRSASLTVAMVTKPNPHDSLVQGSCTMLASITYSTISKPRELFNNYMGISQKWQFKVAEIFCEGYLSLGGKVLLQISIRYTSWQTSHIQVVPRVFSITWVQQQQQQHSLLSQASSSLESTLLNKLYDLSNTPRVTSNIDVSCLDFKHMTLAETH